MVAQSDHHQAGVAYDLKWIDKIHSFSLRSAFVFLGSSQFELLLGALDWDGWASARKVKLVRVPNKDSEEDSL